MSKFTSLHLGLLSVVNGYAVCLLEQHGIFSDRSADFGVGLSIAGIFFTALWVICKYLEELNKQGKHDGD